MQDAAQDTRRWLEKAVIGLNLCPFARNVHEAGRIRIAVTQARHLDAFLEALDEELLRLKTTPPATLATTLLVCPTLFEDFFVFNDMLDVAENVLREHELEGVIQIAPFHPRFQFGDAPPDALSHHTHRSPWPTLHLLREEDLDAVSQAQSEAIVQRNIRLFDSMNPEDWARLQQSFTT